jgi:quinol monooxygenase YgiN
MSILARFTTAPGMNAKKYDEVMPTIEASGQWPPDGLQYHVAFEADGVFRVSEIWESQAKFEAFGQRLMPILQKEGIELAGPPEVLPVHNIIKP